MNIIVVSPKYEMDGPGWKQKLERTVRRAMERSKGHVNSASGMTAALAINYCERLGISYSVRAEADGRGHHMYYVERD